MIPTPVFVGFGVFTRVEPADPRMGQQPDGSYAVMNPKAPVRF